MARLIPESMRRPTDAALNKAETLVWDQWGILNDDDPLAQAEMLDGLAEATSVPDFGSAEVSKWGTKKGLRVQAEVTSYSPAYSSPLSVDVSKVLEGTLYSWTRVEEAEDGARERRLRPA